MAGHSNYSTKSDLHIRSFQPYERQRNTTNMKPLEVIVKFPKEFEAIFGKGQLEQRTEMDVDKRFLDMTKAAIDELSRQGTKEEAARQLVQTIYKSMVVKALQQQDAQTAWFSSH